MMQVDLDVVEDAARELYVRALKILPPDVKAGFDRLRASETSAQGRRILDTMVANIGRRADRQPALPGHRRADLQRRHRPRCRR